MLLCIIVLSGISIDRLDDTICMFYLYLSLCNSIDTMYSECRKEGKIISTNLKGILFSISKISKGRIDDTNTTGKIYEMFTGDSATSDDSDFRSAKKSKTKTGFVSSKSSISVDYDDLNNIIVILKNIISTIGYPDKDLFKQNYLNIYEDISESDEQVEEIFNTFDVYKANDEENTILSELVEKIMDAPDDKTLFSKINFELIGKVNRIKDIKIPQPEYGPLPNFKSIKNHGQLGMNLIFMKFCIMLKNIQFTGNFDDSKIYVLSDHLKYSNEEQRLFLKSCLSNFLLQKIDDKYYIHFVDFCYIREVNKICLGTIHQGGINFVICK